MTLILVYGKVTNVNSKAPSPLKNPLILALDVDDLQSVHRLVGELEDVVGCIKLGPRLIHRFGEKLVQQIAAKVPVFVDCKFFDIPSTMEAAVRASFEAGATFVTIHALAGREALERLAEVETELNQHRPFKILNVTILTSWNEDSYPKSLVKQPVLDHVKSLAAEVEASGMKGIVCSPHELEALTGRGLFLVTPGVRFSLEENSDQKRVMTPQDALKKGASAFVVGRPIVGAKNPREAALDYAVTMVEK